MVRFDFGPIGFCYHYLYLDLVMMRSFGHIVLLHLLLLFTGLLLNGYVECAQLQLIVCSYSMLTHARCLGSVITIVAYSAICLLKLDYRKKTSEELKMTIVNKNE